jgi:hypothetical protein
MHNDTIFLLSDEAENAHVDNGLAEDLKVAGWNVDLINTHPFQNGRDVLEFIKSKPSHNPEEKPWVLGLGLSASLALWVNALDGGGLRGGSRVRATGAADGVATSGTIALSPFLGFDAPFYRECELGFENLREHMLEWARHPVLRRLALHVACPDMSPTGCYGIQRPVSWGRLARNASHTVFSRLLHDLKRPARVILDARHLGLNAERAQYQMSAMNRYLSVQVQTLDTARLATVVTETLHQLISAEQRAHHAQMESMRTDVVETLAYV